MFIRSNTMQKWEQIVTFFSIFLITISLVFSIFNLKENKSLKNTLKNCHVHSTLKPCFGYLGHPSTVFWKGGPRKNCCLRCCSVSPGSITLWMLEWISLLIKAYSWGLYPYYATTPPHPFRLELHTSSVSPISPDLTPSYLPHSYCLL